MGAGRRRWNCYWSLCSSWRFWTLSRRRWRWYHVWWCWRWRRRVLRKWWLLSVISISWQWGCKIGRRTRKLRDWGRWLIRQMCNISSNGLIYAFCLILSLIRCSGCWGSTFLQCLGDIGRFPLRVFDFSLYLLGKDLNQSFHLVKRSVVVSIHLDRDRQTFSKARERLMPPRRSWPFS